MLDKPANWNDLTSEQKRTLRLETWARGDGIEFDTLEAKADYQYWASLFKDAVELKKPPAQVPIAGLGGGFILSHGTQIDDGQEETFRAMVDFTKEYSVYK